MCKFIIEVKYAEATAKDDIVRVDDDRALEERLRQIETSSAVRYKVFVVDQVRERVVRWEEPGPGDVERDALRGAA